MSVHIFGQKRVISINYILKDSEGNLLDSTGQNGPLVFLEGAGMIIPALEAAIIQMQQGEKGTHRLTAEQAYGARSEQAIIKVPKSELAHLTVELGGFLQLQMQDKVQVVRITEIGDQEVTLDGNHPLAGVDLVFDIELVESRTATQEELAHGHAHGPGGHHH